MRNPMPTVPCPRACLPPPPSPWPPLATRLLMACAIFAPGNPWLLIVQAARTVHTASARPCAPSVADP